MFAAAPPANPDGYWHYTYVIFRPDTGEWYGGKHSTKNLNDGYFGSGYWPTRHPLRDELVMMVVDYFESDEAAFAAEASLVTVSDVEGDPLCMNETEGGRGLTVEGARRHFSDPKIRAAHLEGVRRRTNNPTWKENQAAGCKVRSATENWKLRQTEGCRRRSSKPEWQERHRAFLAHLRSDPVTKEAIRQGQIRWASTPEGRAVKLAVLEGVRSLPNWPDILAAALKKAHAPETRAKAGATNKLRNKDRPPEYWVERGRKISQGKAAARLLKLNTQLNA
jgi:hypothetical protein